MIVVNVRESHFKCHDLIEMTINKRTLTHVVTLVSINKIFFAEVHYLCGYSVILSMLVMFVPSILL